MGLPSGVLWAPCNIDVSRPNGFAKSPFQYDCSFFSWGNVDGHNPTGPTSFSPYDWGGVNANEPYYEGQPYGDTPGSDLIGNIPVNVDYDAARANLGEPWRLPTNNDFNELLANCQYINPDGSVIGDDITNKAVLVNGYRGFYLESLINGRRLFLPCSGFGNGTNWSYRGAGGYYRTSGNVNNRNAYYYFGSVNGSLGVNASGKWYGYSIRPVMTL